MKKKPARPFERYDRLKREGKGLAIHPLALGELSEALAPHERVPFLLNPSFRGVRLIQDPSLPRGQIEERTL